MPQFVPSVEVWIPKALPAAVSQFSTIWLMVCVAPRSTCTHCGSLNALDHRVPALPSTAFGARKLPFSVEDAVQMTPGRCASGLGVCEALGGDGDAPSLGGGEVVTHAGEASGCSWIVLGCSGRL